MIYPILFQSLIVFCLSANELPEKPPEVIGTFSWWKHNNPDGTPSRDDRRYRKEILVLYSDHSCKMQEQRGRLSPKIIKIMEGTWEISEEEAYMHGKKLIVHYKTIQYPEFPKNDKQIYSEMDQKWTFEVYPTSILAKKQGFFEAEEQRWGGIWEEGYP